MEEDFQILRQFCNGQSRFAVCASESGLAIVLFLSPSEATFSALQPWHRRHWCCSLTIWEMEGSTERWPSWVSVTHGMCYREHSTKNHSSFTLSFNIQIQIFLPMSAQDLLKQQYHEVGRVRKRLVRSCLGTCRVWGSWCAKECVKPVGDTLGDSCWAFARQEHLAALLTSFLFGDGHLGTRMYCSLVLLLLHPQPCTSLLGRIHGILNLFARLGDAVIGKCVKSLVSGCGSSWIAGSPWIGQLWQRIIHSAQVMSITVVLIARSLLHSRVWSWPTQRRNSPSSALSAVMFCTPWGTKVFLNVEIVYGSSHFREGPTLNKQL